MTLKTLEAMWKKSTHYETEIARSLWNGRVRTFAQKQLPTLEENPFLQLIQRRVPLHSQITALDIGCGTGIYSLALASEIGLVEGCDVADQMITIANQQAAQLKLDNARFHCLDWQTVDIDALGYRGRFDIVFAHMTPAVDDFVTLDNENYWGELPEIQKITVKVIPDNQTRIMALENGEIDLIFGKNMLDADAISQYLDSEEFTVSLSDPTSTRHIVLNTTNSILSDVTVRQALQHATNRAAISEGIFYGLEQPADTLYAETVPYCDVGLEPYAYDADEAARMLEEAGWTMGSDGIREKDGQKLELGLLYNSDSVTEKTIAEYLQSEYLKLGISINIHGEEEQSYRDSMKAGNFDMVFNICWGMPYDPQSSLAAMCAPVYGDYAAQQGLADKAEIDAAIMAALTTTDEAERQELYSFVLTRLHEDAVYIPLTFECNKALYTSDLAGVHFGTDQYDVPFADMYFE